MRKAGKIHLCRSDFPSTELRNKCRHQMSEKKNTKKHEIYEKDGATNG